MGKIQLDFAASTRVMNLPELLRIIFLFSTPEDAASHCRVCQTWFNEAVRAAWGVVDQVRDLLQLLSPVEEDEDFNVHFTQRLLPRNWDRFDKYAAAIHDLDLSGMGEWLSPALAEMGWTRPRMHLFPNLRVLHLAANARAVMMFGGPSVLELTLSWPPPHRPDDTITLLSLLPYVPASMPNLVRLDIALWYDNVTRIETSVDEMLKNLPSLKTLRLPSSWLTSRVTKTLASLSCLEELDSIGDDPGASHEDIFSPVLDAGWFASLETLYLAISCHRAAFCFSQGCQITSLTSLYLWSTKIESGPDLGHLLTAIPTFCPNVDVLSVHCDCDHDDPEADAFVARLSFSMLEPLLACTELQSLELSHIEAFEIYEDELVLLVKSLPKLYQLELNSEPRRPQRHRTPTLSMSALAAIAPYCKVMEVLKLFVDASEAHHPNFTTSLASSPTAATATSTSPFPKLRSLGVGKSPISRPCTVARFLRDILPRGCAIFVSVCNQESEWRNVPSLIDEMCRAPERNSTKPSRDPVSLK